MPSMVRIIRSLSSSSNRLLWDLDLEWRWGENRFKLQKRIKKDMWVMKCVKIINEPFSSVEVILPHWNVLKQKSDHSSTSDWSASMCVCVCLKDRQTYSCVDLAIVCSHAVSMVEVGEGFGGAPGLQISGHSDRRPHLPTVQRGTRAHTQQRAVPLSLRKPTRTEKDT